MKSALCVMMLVLLLVSAVPGRALAASPVAQVGDLTLLLQWLRQLQALLDQLDQWRTLILDQITAWQNAVLEPLTPLFQIADLTAAIQQQLTQLPARFQTTLQSLLTKFQSLPAPKPGSPGWTYQQYAQQNPALLAKARQIAATEVMAATTTTETQATADMSGDIARQVVSDTALPAATLDAIAAAQALAEAAPDIPSTRSGIQMLIAALAAQMQQHASYAQGLADRLQGLNQQEALSARELHALSWALNHQLIRQEKDREEQLAGDLVSVSFTSELVSNTYAQGATPFVTTLQQPDTSDHVLRLVRWTR